MPPKPRICAARDGVIGMRREPRVQHRADARGRASRSSRQAERVRVLPRHAHRQRLQARAQREAGTDRGSSPPAAGLARRDRRSAARPAMTPPVTSLWPLRYFVALCMTRSTPSASGRWLTGSRRCCRSPRATPRHGTPPRRPAMSTHRSVGLIGDSNQTSFVRSEMPIAGDRAARRGSGSASSRRTARGIDCSRCSVPP